MDDATKARMVDERSELNDRIGKLESFMETSIYRELPWIDKLDLRTQVHHMRNYRTALDFRISRLCYRTSRFCR